MDLTARIAAHSILVAMGEYTRAEVGIAVRLGRMSNEERERAWQRLYDAEAALTAALDVDDELHAEMEEARQQLAREVDYDGEEMSTLLGAVTMAGVLYRARGTELERAEDELDAKDRERATTIAEVRHILTMIHDDAEDGRSWASSMKRVEMALTCLANRLENPTPAAAHERPDEPAGLTPCCGKTEPRITSEGGVLVDDPGEVTCPGEGD